MATGAIEPRVAAFLDPARPAGADGADDFVRTESGFGGDRHEARDRPSYIVKRVTGRFNFVSRARCTSPTSPVDVLNPPPGQGDDVVPPRV